MTGIPCFSYNLLTKIADQKVTQFQKKCINLDDFWIFGDCDQYSAPKL